MAKRKKEAAAQAENKVVETDEILHSKKQSAFLAAFAKCGTITKAAEAADIARQTHYDWMKNEPNYPALFAQAEQEAADALEHAARERALAGSDTLMIFLLKGLKPEKFKERTENNNTNNNNNLNTDMTNMSPDERRARIDELNRLRGNGASNSA